MKKLVFLVLIMVGLLTGPVFAEILDQFLGEKVMIIFDADLPSGQRYTLGRILDRGEGWILLITQTKQVYLCNKNHIIRIKVRMIKQGGENEDPSFYAGVAADLCRQFLSR